MKKLILILLILTATTASAAASHDDKHAMNMMMNCPMKIGELRSPLPIFRMASH